ncbi:cupin domain-containing protein [Orrella marina]|uniref:ChrR-like cupin domain-containing protein n=1 Tax=Orrella marina TaxID=2163011 RepID=A0A2R4XHB4_9BURK|nr:cupin domain-containing protein [Orrella marina]AWB33161.1 hypothetical protein DBV39_04915 [Orrella marina]
MTTAVTPFLPNQEQLGPLDSRIVDVQSLPWRTTPSPGVEIKILMQDEQSGLLTALFRWAPGSVLGLHEHVQIEQSYVLEGEFEDDDGVYTEGNFVWRPAGHRHDARSPKGALVLCFFLKPNKFLEGPLAGEELK